MKIFLILSLFIFFTLPVQAHPIKMSTGKLEINTEGKTVLLTLNFFIDDFEAALRKLYPQPAFDYSNPDAYLIITLNKYINTCIGMTADNNKVDFKYYSITKIDDNVCQVKLTADFEKFKSIKKIAVTNTLLFDFFRTQSNILHILIDHHSPHILKFYSGDAFKLLILE